MFIQTIIQHIRFKHAPTGRQTPHMSGDAEYRRKALALQDPGSSATTGTTVKEDREKIRTAFLGAENAAHQRSQELSDQMYNESQRQLMMLHQIAGVDFSVGASVALERFDAYGASQNEAVKSATELIERNADLNKAFGINTVDAQIFANELFRVSKFTGINDVALKKHAAALKEFTNGYINANNQVQAASKSQTIYNTKLLGGQQFMKTNIGLSDEQAMAFERYASLNKTTAFDLNKAYRDASKGGTSFIASLADATGKSELQLTKEIMTEIAGLTSDIQLEYSKMGSNLELAVLKARALGISMTQVSGVGKKLLNVQEAASFETDFQLLTGKRLTVEGGKNFIQEMQLAKMKRDGNRQTELLYEVLKNVGSELENNQFSMDSFTSGTNLSAEQVTAMLGKMKMAEQYGLTKDQFLAGGDALKSKLEEKKAERIETVKATTGKSEEDAIKDVEEEIKSLVTTDEQATITTPYEQQSLKNLTDISEYLYDIRTEFKRVGGKGALEKETGPNKGDRIIKTGTSDYGKQARDIQKVYNAKQGDKIQIDGKTYEIDSKTIQEMKMTLKNVEDATGREKLRDETGTTANIFKELKKDVESVFPEDPLKEIMADTMNVRDATFSGTIKFGQTTLLGPTGATGATGATGTSGPNFAHGGILSGPSHANGGIATPFGELEGGEAIINKRSTAKFTSTLSAINEAEGGRRMVPNYKLGGQLPNMSTRNNNITNNITNDIDINLDKLVDTIKSNNDILINTLQASSQINSPNNAPTNTNNINTTEIANAISNAINMSFLSIPGLDVNKLATAISTAMRNVKIEATAVVKNDNTYRESSLNNAPRFIS